jgi:hypothetical protein
MAAGGFPMSMHNQSPLAALHERLLGLCRHRAVVIILPIGLALLIFGADLLLPSQADYAAFLLVPILLATYCGGWKYGIGLGWVLAAAEQYSRYLQNPSAISGLTIAINFIIWGTVATLLVSLTASVLEMQALREAYVRLRTLQQTMVTVNDIVRNRLAVLLALCDLLEEGRTPTPRQVSRAQSVIEEIVQHLDRLGQVEVVTITAVAGGVEAIDLGAGDKSDNR